MLHVKDWNQFLHIHVLKRNVFLTFFQTVSLSTDLWLIIGFISPCFSEYLKNNFPQNYQRLSWVLLDTFIFYLSKGEKIALKDWNCTKLSNRINTHAAKTLEVRQTPRETSFFIIMGGPAENSLQIYKWNHIFPSKDS